MKIAYSKTSRSFGGFYISQKAIDYIVKHSKYTEENCIWDEIPRHDPILIEALEKFPQQNISIMEINEDRYYIEEYDGNETVYTPKTIPWIIVS